MKTLFVLVVVCFIAVYGASVESPDKANAEVVLTDLQARLSDLLSTHSKQKKGGTVSIMKLKKLIENMTKELQKYMKKGGGEKKSMAEKRDPPSNVPNGPKEGPVEEGRRVLKEVCCDVDRLRRIVEDIVAIVTIEGDLDLDELLDEIIETANDLAPLKDLEIPKKRSIQHDDPLQQGERSIPDDFLQHIKKYQEKSVSRAVNNGGHGHHESHEECGSELLRVLAELANHLRCFVEARAYLEDAALPSLGDIFAFAGGIFVEFQTRFPDR